MEVDNAMDLDNAEILPAMDCVSSLVTHFMKVPDNDKPGSIHGERGLQRRIVESDCLSVKALANPVDILKELTVPEESKFHGRSVNIRLVKNIDVSKFSQKVWKMGTSNSQRSNLKCMFAAAETGIGKEIRGNVVKEWAKLRASSTEAELSSRKQSLLQACTRRYIPGKEEISKALLVEMLDTGMVMFSGEGQTTLEYNWPSEVAMNCLDHALKEYEQTVEKYFVHSLPLTDGKFTSVLTSMNEGMENFYGFIKSKFDSFESEQGAALLSRSKPTGTSVSPNLLEEIQSQPSFLDWKMKHMKVGEGGTFDLAVQSICKNIDGLNLSLCDKKNRLPENLTPEVAYALLCLNKMGQSKPKSEQKLCNVLAQYCKYLYIVSPRIIEPGSPPELPNVRENIVMQHTIPLFNLGKLFSITMEKDSPRKEEDMDVGKNCSAQNDNSVPLDLSGKRKSRYEPKPPVRKSQPAKPKFMSPELIAIQKYLQNEIEKCHCVIYSSDEIHESCKQMMTKLFEDYERRGIIIAKDCQMDMDDANHMQTVLLPKQCPTRQEFFEKMLQICITDQHLDVQEAIKLLKKVNMISVNNDTGSVDWHLKQDSDLDSLVDKKRAHRSQMMTTLLKSMNFNAFQDGVACDAPGRAIKWNKPRAQIGKAKRLKKN